MRQREPRRLRLAALLATLAVACLAAGAVGGVLLAAPPVPKTLQPPEPGALPLESQPFLDPQPVTVSTNRHPDQELTAGMAGRVTAAHCSVNDPLESGRVDYAIDSVHILSLATEVPLWRDLAVGAAGVDAAALKTELARLGATIVPGPISVADVAAFDSLRGVGKPVDGVIEASSVLWLPSVSTAVTSCTALLGDRVEPGTPVATARGVVEARVDVVPDTGVEGDRQLVVDGRPIALDPDGRVAASSLEEWTSSDAYRSAAASAADAATFGVPATLQLREPVEVYAVPASVITTDSEGSTCVGGPRGAIAVRVLGSQLGRSLVTFPGAAPGEIDDVRPDACV